MPQPQVHPAELPSVNQTEMQEQDPWSMEWKDDDWQVDQTDQGDTIPFNSQAQGLEQSLEQYGMQERIPLESENQLSNDPFGFEAAPGVEQSDPWGFNNDAQDYGEPFLDPSQYDAELENLMGAAATNIQSPQNAMGQFEQQNHAQEVALNEAEYFQGYGDFQNQDVQEPEFLSNGAYDTQSFLPEHTYDVQEGYSGDDYAQGEYAQDEYAQGEYAQGEYAQDEYGQGEYGQGEYAEMDYVQGHFAQDEYNQHLYNGYDYTAVKQPGEEQAQDLYNQGDFNNGIVAQNEYAQSEQHDLDVYATDAYAEPEQQEPTQLPPQPSMPVEDLYNPTPAPNLVSSEAPKPEFQQKPMQSRSPVQTAHRTVATTQAHSEASKPPIFEPLSTAPSASYEPLQASHRPLAPPKAAMPKSGSAKAPTQQPPKGRMPADPPAQRKVPPRARSPAKPQNKLLSPPVVAERGLPPPGLKEPMPASSLEGDENWGWNDGAEVSSSDAVNDAWGWDGNDQGWQQPEMVEKDTHAQKSHASPNRAQSKPVPGPSAGKAGVKVATKPKNKALRSDPIQERLGKTVPVASFGVGGKLIVYLPQSKAEGDAYEYDTPRIMRQVHIRPLVSYMGARPFSTLDMHKFPGPLMESSKSNYKGKKAALLKYLHEQIAESASGVGYLRRKSALFSTESPMSEQGHVEEWRRMEDKILLLKILALLVENDGQWNASGPMATTVCNLLTGRSEEAELGAFTVPTYSRTSSQSAMKRPIRTYALRQGFLEELQPMLQQGDLQRAVDYAMEEKMWAHAMTISQQLDASVRNRVIEEFMRYELEGPPVDNILQKDYTSIKVAYALYSNQSSDQITAMFRDSASLSPEAQHAQWRHAVATLIANHNVANGYETIVNTIGESLMKNGLPEASHVCYLLSHQHRKWLSSASSPFLLLGTTPLTPVSALVNDMDALLMTEVLEFILCLSQPKGAEPFSGIPALAPFKLMRAIVCDELGDMVRAKKYCEALVQLSQTKGTAQILPSNVQLQLHEFMARLNGPRADANHSWSKKLQRPTLDGVWGALEGRLTKFIAGEEMTPETQPAKTTGKGVGAFTHYSAITPEVASSDAPSASGVDINNAYEDQVQTGFEYESGQGQGGYVEPTALNESQGGDVQGEYAQRFEFNNDKAQENLGQGHYGEETYVEGGYPEGDYPEGHAEDQYDEDQYQEGQYTEGDNPESQYAEGEYAEGDYPEGEYAEGDYPEGEYAEGEYAKGDYPEGEYAEGEYAEGEYAEGDYPEGEYAKGEYAEGDYPEGEYPEGEVAEGEYAEGEVAEGQYPEGDYAKDDHLEGKHAEDPHLPSGGDNTSDPTKEDGDSGQMKEQDPGVNDINSKPTDSGLVSKIEEVDSAEQTNESKPPLFHRVDAEAQPEVGEDGLISTMSLPTLGPVPVSAPKHESTNTEVVDDAEDDLGLGNASHKEPEKPAETEPEKPSEKVPVKPAEKSTGNSWLGRLLGSRSNAQSQSDKESKASKAHLGEETSFYYDKDLKRWVNKKAGDDGKAAPAALPPPPKAPVKAATSSSEKQGPPAPQKKQDGDAAKGNTTQAAKTTEAGYGDPPVRKPTTGKPGDRPPTGGSSKKRPLKSRYIVVD